MKLEFTIFEKFPTKLPNVKMKETKISTDFNFTLTANGRLLKFSRPDKRIKVHFYYLTLKAFGSDL